VGTTTVVLRLLNLESGEIIADASFENPQRFGGSDVMARIQYDTEDGTHVLQRTLASYLTHAIEELPVDPNTIYEMVVAGNSTMRDLFFRLNVYSIGQSPYRSATELTWQPAAELPPASSNPPNACPCRSIPGPASTASRSSAAMFGADAAACMLAVDLANEERLVAIMDIGTNTELILGNRHRILAHPVPPARRSKAANSPAACPD